MAISEQAADLLRRALGGRPNLVAEIVGGISGAGGGSRTYTFVLAIGVSAATGTNLTNQLTVDHSGTITKAFINAKVGPTGANLVVDINKNGATIWSTQANRLKIVAGTVVGTQSTFDTIAVAEGDVLSIDIDQVGSTIPGQDITVQLVVEF